MSKLGRELTDEEYELIDEMQGMLNQLIDDEITQKYSDYSYIIEREIEQKIEEIANLCCKLEKITDVNCYIAIEEFDEECLFDKYCLKRLKEIY